MGRRIMRAFKMNEISAVDRPAQVHARVSIMKRDVTSEEPVLKLTNEEVNMTLEDLKKMIDDAVGSAVAGLKKDDGGLSEAEVTKRINDAVAKALADAKAAMDAEVAKQVEAGVKAELAKRDEIAKSDSVFTYEGSEIRKSVVGEATFSMLKGLYEKDQNNEFGKRADTETKNLPGTTLEKAAVLRFLAGAPEAIRKSAEAMFKSGHEAMGKLLKSAGSDRSNPDGSLTAQQQIDKKVSDLMTADPKLSKVDALSKVMATDEGNELYKRSLTEKPGA